MARNNASIDEFVVKYSQYVGDRYLISQKDVGTMEMLKLKPIYMVQYIIESL